MKNLLIILFFLIAGCTSKQQVSSIQPREQEPTIFEISVVESEDILFTIKNISNEQVNIYQPRKLHIEKFNNGTWERLRILQCPCGAPCAKPPEKIKILNQEKYVRTWNKYESWCGEQNEFGIPKTLKAKALNGMYRLRVLYGIGSKQKETIYKEFELK